MPNEVESKAVLAMGLLEAKMYWAMLIGTLHGCDAVGGGQIRARRINGGLRHSQGFASAFRLTSDESLTNKGCVQGLPGVRRLLLARL